MATGASCASVKKLWRQEGCLLFWNNEVDALPISALRLVDGNCIGQFEVVLWLFFRQVAFFILYKPITKVPSVAECKVLLTRKTHLEMLEPKVRFFRNLPFALVERMGYHET